MRNRNLILFLAVLVATVLAAGCGTMRSLTQDEKDRLDNIQGMIEMAEMKDGKICAPKELAVAQADLAQARIECTQSWEKCKAGAKPAAEGATAQKSVDALMKKIQACEDAKKIPVIMISAEPEMVAPGKCATLKWSTENVTKLVEGPDDKKSPEVPLAGSKEVCPKETTEYQLTGYGPGGTNYEFATVKVGEPPPPPPPPPPPAPAPVMVPVAPVPKAPQKAELRVNFDTNKYTIRPADLAELQKGVQFLKDNPDAKILVVGYTDSRGDAKYNQKLSERRAEAVKKYLEGEVAIKPENITSEGKGEADPVGDNKTKEGQFQNRRVELTIEER